MKLLESKSSPATKLNQLAMSAGMLLGGSAATALSVGLAMAEEGDVGSAVEDKLVAVINGLFGNVQGVAGPLFGLIILVCLVGMGVSVLNGNSNGMRAWRTGLISVVVLLILIYAVPTLVNWAASFGNSINGTANLSSAFDGLEEGIPT